MNKLVQARLYLVLWQRTATVSLCWQLQRPRRHHRSSRQVKNERTRESIRDSGSDKRTTTTKLPEIRGHLNFTFTNTVN